MLADFRTHLESLTDAPPPPVAEPPAVDLAALVAQFTALRHDVNLQTKATRAATEQAAQAVAALQQVAVGAKPTDPAEHTRPLLKAVIDVADTLAVAVRQVNKSRSLLVTLLTDLTGQPLPPLPAATDVAPAGFFGKLFGGRKSPSYPSAALLEWVRQAEDASTTRASAAERLATLLTGVADGYAMSLRRVEKLLPAHGLEPIPCVGRPFDPELMEVVEVVGGGTQPSGTVVEEVRKGYRQSGTVFRFALVKVAR